MMLILDLDDTIFETKSINPTTFQPVISLVENFFLKNHGIEKAQMVVDDLWKIPFDAVVKKHAVPTFLQKEFYQTLETLDYKLEIKYFEDYPFLKNIDKRKILVTTGFTKLQTAKIEALNIQEDFEEIHIDNPLDKNRKYKKGIFQKIISDTKISPQDIWVIGDNPNSEIIAGKELGMRTIQRLNAKSEISPNADFSIHSFFDLENIF